MVGYDLDGVIAQEKPWFKYLYRICPELMVFIRDLYRPRYVPHGLFVIITNRPVDDLATTLFWLSLNEISPSAVFFASKAVPGGYEEKAMYIRNLGVKVFFESDCKVVSKLRMLCPKTEVVHVK